VVIVSRLDAGASRQKPLEARDRRRLIAALVGFVVVWTLYAAISSAPDAIHGDMAEAYVWGREFQLGYYKHPPFWAWVVGIWFSFAPRTGASFDLLCILNAGLGLVGAWRLVGDFSTGDKRIAATFLLVLTPFYTFMSLKYNANSIFLSIWPWTLHAFVRSFQTRGVRDGALFGVLMAVAMLSKYFAIILGLSCGLAALVHPDRRLYLASPAPYVSLTIGLLAFSPHVWWLFRTDFPPVHYVGQETRHNLASSALYSVKLLLACIAYHTVAAGLILAAGGWRPGEWVDAMRERWREPRCRFMLILAFSPVVLTALFGAILHLKVSANMTIGVFALVPLALIDIFGVLDLSKLRRLSVLAAGVISLVMLALSPAIAYARIWLAKDPTILQPRIELAKEVTRIWHDHVDQPIAYVAGGDLYPDAIAFYSVDNPHSFINFDYAKAPWVTPADLAKRGLLGVCLASDQTCISAARQFSTQRTIETNVVVRRQFWGHLQDPYVFLVLLTPPRPAALLPP
jgi:hypothetical protein